MGEEYNLKVYFYGGGKSYIRLIENSSESSVSDITGDGLGVVKDLREG